MNRLIKAHRFVVGEGITINEYSDRKAATVIAVSKGGKQITVQRDKATLLNGANSKEADKLVEHVGGFCANVQGKQRYVYERDENGSIHHFSIRVIKDLEGEFLNEGGVYSDRRCEIVDVERWNEKGEVARNKNGVSVGRYEYYDFNF